MITDILCSSNIVKPSCNFAIGVSSYSRKTFPKQLEPCEFHALGSRNRLPELPRFNFLHCDKIFEAHMLKVAFTACIWALILLEGV